jgi:hypothetical protein
MTITHCRPNGALASNEMPVPNISEKNTRLYSPSGNSRGVIVGMHGLSTVTQPIPPALLTANVTTALFTDYTYQFIQAVIADGWKFLAVPYPEDFYSAGAGLKGIYNSVVSDPNHGKIYVENTTMLWVDHVIRFIQRKHGGPTVPIIFQGGSWGGYHTLLIASKKKARLAARTDINDVPDYVDAGYCACIPATFFETINPLFTTGVDPSAINASGLVLDTHILDDVDTPGAIGYGTSDIVVGYGSSTVAAASNGVDVASFTGSGTLTLASVSTITNGPLIRVQTSTGWAIISFTAINAGPKTLTGCKTHFGSGLLSTNGIATQNNVSDIIASQQAANPTNQVSTYSSASYHEMPSAMMLFMSDWIHDNVTPNYDTVF